MRGAAWAWGRGQEGGSKSAGWHQRGKVSGSPMGVQGIASEMCWSVGDAFRLRGERR